MCTCCRPAAESGSVRAGASVGGGVRRLPGKLKLMRIVAVGAGAISATTARRRERRLFTCAQGSMASTGLLTNPYTPPNVFRSRRDNAKGAFVKDAGIALGNSEDRLPFGKASMAACRTTTRRAPPGSQPTPPDCDAVRGRRQALGVHSYYMLSLMSPIPRGGDEQLLSCRRPRNPGRVPRLQMRSGSRLNQPGIDHLHTVCGWKVFKQREHPLCRLCRRYVFRRRSCLLHKV